MDINDPVAVVTGAGVGSGLAIAERLLDEGARVGTYGGVSVLVNNAGGGAHPPARFPDATPELTELPDIEPPPIPLSDLCDAVVDLVREAGKVVVLQRWAA